MPASAFLSNSIVSGFLGAVLIKCFDYLFSMNKTRVDATTAKEQRIDKRVEALFEQYEGRLSELEGQVQRLEADLKVEKEDRRFAETAGQAAHIRADEAEENLRKARRQLAELQAEQDGLKGLSAQQQERIRLLEERILELEAELALYKKQQAFAMFAEE